MATAWMRTLYVLLQASIVSSSSLSSSSSSRLPHAPRSPSRTTRRPAGVATHATSSCDERYYEQTLDHFGSLPGPDGVRTFDQRFFVCGQSLLPSTAPIFFYVGNEADVELYLNATGLMWENQKRFNATLIFAEHRYFGKSLPSFLSRAIDNAPPLAHMNYLTAEQALADYATLIWALREQGFHGAFIGFGGSYGGMLATWLRIKYPSAIAGAIAASAPVVSFLGLTPKYDANSYANQVTIDASTEGGANDACEATIRSAWTAVFERSTTDTGRQELNEVFHLCPDSLLKSEYDGYALAYWLQSSFDYMAMGSYPFASSYILNGQGELPPYPLREACKLVGTNPLTGVEALVALDKAVGIFYNYSHTQKCYSTQGSANNETTRDGLYWDYLYCSGMIQPFARNGKTDMFWPQPFDLNATVEECRASWGIEFVHSEWPLVSYGGWRLESSSNILFSNGDLDPWSGGGVTHNISETIVAITIPEVGHHIDLMFSHPDDLPAVTQARKVEMSHVRRWIRDHQLDHNLQDHHRRNKRELVQ